MVKYPFVKQEYQKDCGAACLQMIVKYYHGYIDLEELRSLTKTGKNGTNAYNLIKGAETIGFLAKGFKCPLKNLKNQYLRLPAIAHVTLNNSYKHFVVIYQVDDKKKVLTIADPAVGIKQYSFIEFEKIFNSVIITFEPIKKIPYNKEFSVISFFLLFLKSFQKDFHSLFIRSLFLNIFAVIASFYSQYLFNNIGTQGKSYLFLIFFTFLLVTFLKIIFSCLKEQSNLIISQKIELYFENNFYNKLFNLPYSSYYQINSGDLFTRMEDFNRVKKVIAEVVVTLFFNGLQGIILLLCLFFLNKYLFLLSTFFIVLSLLSLFCIQKKWLQYLITLKQKESNKNAFLLESLHSLESIKANKVEKNFIKEARQHNCDLLEEEYHFQRFAIFFQCWKSFLSEFSNLLLLFLGALLVVDQKFQLGSLLTFCLLFSNLSTSLETIFLSSFQWKDLKVSLKRIMALEEGKKQLGFLCTSLKGNIILNNLNFQFLDEPLLKECNISIKAGEKVMITGISGSGKSTFFHLLLRDFKTKRGMIFLDDEDINDYDVDFLHQKIAYVPQKGILFSKTIKENILLGRTCKNKDFLKICHLCEIDSIIEKKDNGYNFVIEENGNNLSGGEIARIFLARSLVAKPNILLFDETFSNIDVNQERRILKNLFQAYSNKTILVISHRIDNLDMFDQNIVMKKNKMEGIKRNVTL